MWALGVGIAYYAMYHSDNWTQRRGWKTYRSRMPITDEDPEWPHNTSQIRTKTSQYWDMGFSKSGV